MPPLSRFICHLLIYAVSRQYQFFMASGINRIFARGPWHRKLPFAVIFRCLRAFASTAARTRPPAKHPFNNNNISIFGIYHELIVDFARRISALTKGLSWLQLERRGRYFLHSSSRRLCCIELCNTRQSFAGCCTLVSTPLKI